MKYMDINLPSYLNPHLLSRWQEQGNNWQSKIQFLLFLWFQKQNTYEDLAVSVAS